MKRKKRELQVNLPLRKEMWRFTIFNSFKAKLPARRLHHQEKKKKKEKKICYASGQNLTLFKFIIFLLPGNGEDYENEFYRKKNIPRRYTQILVEFPRLVAGSSEWTLLKPLYYGRLVCWLPAAQELFIRADRTLTRLRCGEKLVWKGIKRSRGPFSLVPRLPLNSPIFCLLSFSPTAEPGPSLKLIAVQDFVFS